MTHEGHGIRTALVWLLVLLTALSIGLLKWDDSRSTCEPMQLDGALLQEIAAGLPVPGETVEGETTIQRKGLRAIVVYYAEPVTEQRARELTRYFQEEAQQYRGSYIALNGENAAALTGDHRYSSVLDKLGYGWFHSKGNLYADYTDREQAKGKPNYRNRYDVSLVNGTVCCRFVLFCNRQEPEKALSAAAEQLSVQIGTGADPSGGSGSHPDKAALRAAAGTRKTAGIQAETHGPGASGGVSLLRFAENAASQRTAGQAIGGEPSGFSWDFRAPNGFSAFILATTVVH